MRRRAALAPRSGTDLEQLLASMLEEWPLLLTEPVPPALARAHVAMAATVTRPAVPAVAPSSRPAPRLRRRRRFALAAVTSSFVGHMLLGTAAVAAVGAGAAAAGVLPPTVQAAVSELADHVGVHLPSGTPAATPGVPAQPGDPGDGATPAVPAEPPVPPESQNSSAEFGLTHRPVVPATPALPPDPEPETLGDLLHAVRATPASAALDHRPDGTGQGGSKGVGGPPDGVPAAGLVGS